MFAAKSRVSLEQKASFRLWLNSIAARLRLGRQKGRAVIA